MATILQLRSQNRQGDPYVLMTADAGPGEKTATYQLAGGPDVTLRDYVGQQVKVPGTVRAEENIASTSGAVSQKPKSTSGTPVVETETHLDVKQMTVTSLTPMGQRCAPEPNRQPEQNSPRRIK